MGEKDSNSPLATRRGNQDPVNVDDSKLNLDFGHCDYDRNTVQPPGADRGHGRR
jgi:hypothetical protein